MQTAIESVFEHASIAPSVSAIFCFLLYCSAIFIPTAVKRRLVLDHAHKILSPAYCIKYLGMVALFPYTGETARGTVQPGRGNNTVRQCRRRFGDGLSNQSLAGSFDESTCAPDTYRPNAFAVARDRAKHWSGP